MTMDPYPNEDDLRELADAHDRLAANGVLPGAHGYDIETLAATSYRYGWSYRIDRSAGILGYQVELRPQHGLALQPMVSALGWEPEVAMAFALSRALSQRAHSMEISRGRHTVPATMGSEE